MLQNQLQHTTRSRKRIRLPLKCKTRSWDSLLCFLHTPLRKLSLLVYDELETHLLWFRRMSDHNLTSQGIMLLIWNWWIITYCFLWIYKHSKLYQIIIWFLLSRELLQIGSFLSHSHMLRVALFETLITWFNSFEMVSITQSIMPLFCKEIWKIALFYWITLSTFTH